MSLVSDGLGSNPDPGLSDLISLSLGVVLCKMGVLTRVDVRINGMMHIEVSA